VKTRLTLPSNLSRAPDLRRSSDNPCIIRPKEVWYAMFRGGLPLNGLSALSSSSAMGECVLINVSKGGSSSFARMTYLHRIFCVRQHPDQSFPTCDELSVLP
jgi:hypothetical protein